MMSDAVDELKAELMKSDGGTLHPASEEDIEQARLFGLPPVLIDFYRENAPDPAIQCVELDQRIWSVRNAISENTDYVPGAYLFPLGYVVFASNMCGDAYCIDTVNVTTTGECPVVLFPHDDIDEGASLADVEPHRLTIACDLEDFLRKFARRSLVKEPEYDPSRDSSR
jgi:hypothetical protein